ncbi:hypothetical protein QJQ45_003252 [Haematococcus lacustris]|nr:hypothetical protein QJQ45_003252 [Haematococcus lacustris]
MSWWRNAFDDAAQYRGARVTSDWKPVKTSCAVLCELTSLLFMPAQVLATLQARREERREEWKTRPQQVIMVPSGAVLRDCQKTRRKILADFQLRAEVRSQMRPASMDIDWDPGPGPEPEPKPEPAPAPPTLVRVFCECYANFLTPYNELQRHHGRPKQNLHYIPKLAFDEPSNQELLAKLQQLGNTNLTGDHNTISHHSMQLAVAMQQHYSNPGK